MLDDLPTNDALKIEDGDLELGFLFLYSGALQCYVSARVCLLAGLSDPGVFLGHQCIELLTKAITRLEPQADHPWGHNLNDLIKKANEIVPKFTEIINDNKVSSFLDNLSDAYNKHRYGEARSTINSLEIAKLLDDIVFKLRGIYTETIKYPGSKLFVPEKLSLLFLEQNDFFDESKITAHPMASFGLPGFHTQ